MTNLLDQAELVVKHRPKAVELRVGYDVYDAQGSALGSVVQVGRDNLERTLRPQRADNAQTALDMIDASGEVLLRLTHIQALKSSLVVAYPDGSDAGRIRLENIVGKSRFALEVAGSSVGAMAAQTWRKRNFVIADSDGAAVGRIDMTKGSSADFAHENDYRVQLAQPLADPLRSLAAAAVIAVDMILWER
jgi:hypothetical protein